MPANFSWGIFSLFAWLVPHVSIEIGEYRRSLSRSAPWSSSDDNLRLGKRVAARQSLVAVLSALLLVAGTALGVALTTQGLDPNMVSIIEGMSLLTSAVFTLAISCKAPKWIGAYFSRKRAESQPLGRSVKALAFNVRWSVWRQHCRVYFCLLPYYCGANAITIPVSIIAGILFGFVLDYCIYTGRRRREVKPRSRFAFGMAAVVLAISAALFQQGARYIDDVWGRRKWEGKDAELGAIAAAVWFAGGLMVHVFLWRLTSRMVKEHGLGEGVTTGYLAPAHTRKGERLATSIMREMYQSYRRQKDDRAARGDKKGRTVELSLSQVAEGDEDEEANHGPAKSAEGDDFDNENKEQALLPGSAPEGSHDEDNTFIAAAEEAGVGVVELPPVRSENPSGSNGTGGRRLSNQGPMNASEKVEGTDEEETGDNELDENPPSTCSLLRGKLCGCNRAEFKRRSRLEQAVTISEYILWALIAMGFTFFTVINIGAQRQVAAVNAKFPIAEKAIYTDMDEGAVCAIREADDFRPDSNITTFPSRDAANAGGFRVLHCGACGACSTWRNLRMEFWTRNYLAAESARCAKKSLGGGRDAVYRCLMEAPIMFDAECSECWTQDIVCTRNHCAFIYLQSQLINKVANFDVAPGEITSATCEEAHCEMDPAPGVPGFVNCSGATRRRMRIQSTIRRPPEQQCNIVEVTWEDLFGPCCEGVEDFGPAIAEVREEEGWRRREL